MVAALLWRLRFPTPMHPHLKIPPRRRRLRLGLAVVSPDRKMVTAIPSISHCTHPRVKIRPRRRRGLPRLRRLRLGLTIVSPVRKMAAALLRFPPHHASHTIRFVLASATASDGSGRLGRRLAGEEDGGGAALISPHHAPPTIRFVLASATTSRGSGSAIGEGEDGWDPPRETASARTHGNKQFCKEASVGSGLLHSRDTLKLCT